MSTVTAPSELARENALVRRAPHRNPRDRILIYAGLAESAYLCGLYTFAGHPAVVVRPVPEPVAADQLIALAEEQRSRHPDEADQVWCVLDAEGTDLARLRARADEAGVRLAISHLCFESWLVLHQLDRAPEPGNRDGALRLLRKYLPDYDRLRLDFADFQAGVQTAVAAARSLDTQAPANPSSGLWRLVAGILGPTASG